MGGCWCTTLLPTYRVITSLKYGHRYSGGRGESPQTSKLELSIRSNVPLLGFAAQDACRVRSKIQSGERVCPFLPLLNRVLSVLQAQVVLLWRGRHDDKFIEVNGF